ncbi:hypothetical protein F511_26878 [Dorcoceras hygrometricum]|uniref:Uncharacterized protein n=1 Tax=Dorcoceras hygrometricum TaxID=472368 RepID=A0A2Z7A2L6_9LAMI|nr:hypothetical protein F511_26878 [Dorcoceras hygrometricum]
MTSAVMSPFSRKLSADEKRNERDEATWCCRISRWFSVDDVIGDFIIISRWFERAVARYQQCTNKGNNTEEDEAVDNLFEEELIVSTAESELAC